MKAKRIIAVLLSVLLTLSCVSVIALNASAASSMTISSDKNKASIGEIITVSVGIPSGISGIQCVLSFDNAYFTVVSAKPTNAFGNAAVSVKNNRVGYAAAMNGKTAEPGVIFTVQLKVNKMGGTVTVNCIEALDRDDNALDIGPASITINPGDKIINFSDVGEGEWYYGAVEYCAEKGYITGYNDGRFGPSDTIQRQDFVLIFARINGIDLSKYANKTVTFKDAVKGTYYYGAIAWGVQEGIITGYNSSKFGVGDSVTREQVCTIIYRYMKSPEVSDADGALADFADRDKISAFAYDAVAWCVENGVISGKNATTVAPLEGASRAQIATIVMRMDKAGMFAD